jgi:hypothetical protein
LAEPRRVSACTLDTPNRLDGTKYLVVRVAAPRFRIVHPTFDTPPSTLAKTRNQLFRML